MFGKHPANQQTTMTILRLALAAHQGDAMLIRPVQKPVDRLTKVRLARHLSVESVAVHVIVLLLAWTSAQLLPEEEVAKVACAKSRGKILMIELWSKA